MLTEKIREFYSDKIEHTNTELYNYLDAQTEEERHNVRGLQQTLKRQGFLINTKTSTWMINPEY